MGIRTTRMGGLCSAEERPNKDLAISAGARSEGGKQVLSNARDAIAHVKAELDKVWVGLDQDRDGSVTKEELQAALNRTGLHNDKRLKQLFAQLGGSKMGGARQMFMAFDALDEDHNGKISKEEFFATFY